MASRLLSDTEKDFIKRGVKENIRADGRTDRDYMNFKIITGDVSNTSGSAEIKLDRTNIIVGVKAEIDTPSSTNPNEGRIQFFVDCSALASPDFQGREGEDQGNMLAHRLADIYSNSKCLDLSSLCIIPGQQCWVLYVDSLVLEWSGGMLDCLSIAVKAALSNTRLFPLSYINHRRTTVLSRYVKDLLIGRIPKLEVTGEGEEMEIEVSDNPYDAEPLDITNVPIIVTLSLIGDRFVVNATHEEETCADCQLSVAMDTQGRVCGVTKDGDGVIPMPQYYKAMELAKEVARDVHETTSTSIGTNTDNKMVLN